MRFIVPPHTGTNPLFRIVVLARTLKNCLPVSFLADAVATSGQDEKENADTLAADG
jgi:hypothetical protein